MASDRELRAWVSDRLHDVAGFSDRTTADFILATARKAKAGPAALARALSAAGLPDTPPVAAFAAELLSRLPSSSGAGGAARAAAAEARALAKRNRGYGLIEDEEEAAEEEERRRQQQQRQEEQQRTTAEADAARAAAAAEAAASGARARADKHLRRSKAVEGGEEEDDTVVRGAKRSKRQWEEEEEGEDGGGRRGGGGAPGDEAAVAAARREAELEADQREREEFEARLRERDDSKTKKLAEEEPRESRRDRERRAAAALGAPDRAALVPLLRDVSRQEYLARREADKLAALEDEIRDEEFLFAGKEHLLTDRERADLAYKRRVLELAKERKAQLESVDAERYVMPTSYGGGFWGGESRLAAAKARYQEPKGDDAAAAAGPMAEQDRWEAEQLGRTRLGVGVASARAEAAAEEAAKYELLFEDQIEFVKEELLAGDGDDDDALSARERERAARLAAIDDERARMQAERKELPIYPWRQEFLDAVAAHQIIIIVAETGAGKTTQLPQYLHEAGYSKLGRIGCTQPRRVAAMSVAARVAHEMGVKLGHEVGYSIRFEDCTSDKTLIKYMTDGMLLREFLSEPDLASYSVMMIDEAHERTLHTDVLFGLVKDIGRFRPDLKLLVSSATLAAEKFSAYFDDAPVFQFPGRRYEVEVFYAKAPEADYVDAAIQSVLRIHTQEPAGDVLVFFTGQEEIEAAEELLKQRTRGLGSRIAELVVAPIYANLPSEMQARIFEPTPPGARKVVLATNIAETSLTIDGIRYVVDPGFAKQNSYNPRTGMESLLVAPISRASANQRAGRAGRTSAGKCYRIYTHWAFMNEMDPDTVPEIQRTNLGNVVLLLKSLGIHDLVNFDFMDPPPAEALLRALEQLYALGALNDRGELTKLGRRMAEFPLDPQLAKALLASEKFGVSEDVATVCAMVSIGSAVFYRPKDKALHADNAHKAFSRGGVGDHVMLLNCYNAWAEAGFSSAWCAESFVQAKSMKRARDIRDQLVGLMERVEVEMASDPNNTDGIKKSVAAGFFYHTARLQRDGSYRTVKAPTTVHIHPSSSLREALPKWVVYHELVLTSKEFMRTVSEIKADWLVELAPHYYSRKDIADDGKKLPKGKGRAADA
ncbi:pre-mRNA-splicing factor ATP-dependent RNA helicase [Raphidocelis subcapitata]|uniref:RNA helicase n=1 Tax=Raphidocelis subcapitata TaxID=307507 RepID=A0A2V0NYA0_9CHLO|nr:pre-mRNA-splicing factor ATP-dependent RNA helicase [Raphidocelis subcapitata]|eukprot:GBF92309.1 pre-mRNA-splicing factor ATP-dependent RNA helicase [Raphidocelis subcapitata]